jgi:hypothetical protein
MYNFSIFLENLNDNSYGINNIELKDGVFGKALAEMTGAEVEEIRTKLILLRKKIVLYTVSHDLSDYDYFVRLIRRAHLLNIENIKLCLCTLKNGAGGIEKVLELARAMDIKIVFEPKAEYDFFDHGSYAGIKTPYTGIIYNPLAYLKLGLNPFLKVLYKYRHKNDILFLRVNDGIMHTGKPTLPEEGNGEIKECASALLVRSFKGYFSFTDYLKDKKGEVIERFCQTLTRM